MKHVIDAMHYWAEKAPENMAVPFIITIELDNTSLFDAINNAL